MKKTRIARNCLKGLSVIVFIVCMATFAIFSASASTTLPNDVYLAAQGSNTCTLASAAMMLRSRAYLSGNDNWKSITESSIRSVAWGSQGLNWSFSYSFTDGSITVGHNFQSGISISGLKSLLNQHTEGIVLYVEGPHAVFLTDYEGDTFYCADPYGGSYSNRRLPLASSSFNRTYANQAEILSHVTAYWYITNYSIQASGAYIDVNGCLDGANTGTLGNYGTMDMYINDECKADDQNDYYVRHPKGTRYEVKNIQATPGYVYLPENSGPLKGTISSGTTINIRLYFARLGNLYVEGMLDGVNDSNIDGYGQYDVYINNEPDEINCTHYNKQWPDGTTYEIRNIRSQNNKNYDHVSFGALTGTITNSTEQKVVLDFSSDGTSSTEWQIGKVVPGNLDPETLDIEYKHHYETVSTSSPGNDWIQGSVVRSYYQNKGSVEEFPYEKATSDTYVYVGGYYYHWCGSNNNCNYERVSGKYETYHGPNALDLFSVAETGTDTNNSAVKYYKLTWKPGQQYSGAATCATGQSSCWYRKYQYQPRVLITEYNWSKETDWTDTPDETATSHIVRWRLKGGIAPDPENITAITAPDSITMFCGKTQHLDIGTVPQGISASILQYEIANEDLFEIDEQQNIHCKYAGENTSTTLIISAPNGVTKMVQLIARVSSTSQWQTNGIPDGIDPGLLEIEYKHHYETVSVTSPGEGWNRGNVNQSYYQNKGSVEEFPYEKATSDTYVYVGGYYYHWCGSNNNCNYERVSGKYETYHGPNALDLFNVAETGTDTNNSAVKYYKLTWKPGQQYSGAATCATGQSSCWYRKYQYQPRVLITEYNWSKDTEWTDTLDSAATSYSMRWRLNPQTSQESMYLPANTKVIQDHAFYGTKAKFFFLPSGVNSIGDQAFPANSYVFLNTASLNDYNFAADQVWFVETGNYNESFEAMHNNYLLRSDSQN